MGADKARLPVGGRPLIDHVARAVSDLGGPVAVIGGQPDLIELITVDVAVTHVPDTYPGEGPVGGVLTALDAFATWEYVAVVACDLIDLDSALLTQLRDEVDESRVLCAVAVDQGIPQWHVTVWNWAARSLLHRQFEGGARSFHRATRGLALARVELVDAAPVDLDTPADVEHAERRRFPPV